MRRGAAALLLLALTATGCGGDGGDGGDRRSSDRSSTTSTTAGATTTEPSTSTGADADPDLAAVRVAVTQVGRFEQPLDLKWCAGQPDPFVVQKTGQVRNFRTGQVVLDLSAQISSNGEQGLLGLACTRAGDALFVNYTSRDGRQDRVDRFAMPSPGATVDRGTQENVLSVPDPAPNHNGGAMQLGPDGHIWYGLGDGGGANDQYGNAQDTGSRLGKILRIDPANDSVQTAVHGMRNPWRISFDRATGDLWIGDVGQGQLEEIDLLPAGRIIGANGGWPLYEGTRRFKAGADPANLVFPVFEYGRSEGQSVTGGYVYRGNAIPALRGAYLFADAYTANLRAIVVEGGKTVQQRVLGVTVPGDVLGSFAEDPNGELYALSLGGGVFRIDPA
jgi:glucose/arabinose dehydrogenase